MVRLTGSPKRTDPNRFPNFSGFYVLLFVLWLKTRTLQRKEKNPLPAGGNEIAPRRLYLLTPILLFALATLSVIINTYLQFRQSVISFRAVAMNDADGLFNRVLGLDDVFTGLSAVSSFLLVFSNVLADAVLIHRCYLIWNSRLILFTLAAFALGTNALGLAATTVDVYGASHTPSNDKTKIADTAQHLKNSFMTAAGGVNLVITLMTATRIWTSTGEARAFIGGSTAKLYRRIVAIILESGIPYPLFIIGEAILMHDASNTFPVIDFAPTLPLIAGIAPTLIIVRAHYGKRRAGNGTSRIDAIQISDIRFTQHSVADVLQEGDDVCLPLGEDDARKKRERRRSESEQV
ncbi:hypothetical protein L218DRAFT_947363 [Marasmius fiardii PR-910]|nr:hypothetical protein L218DRAFT_947363 [Marasmius fiardii PR-910]